MYDNIATTHELGLLQHNGVSFHCFCHMHKVLSSSLVSLQLVNSHHVSTCVAHNLRLYNYISVDRE